MIHETIKRKGTSKYCLDTHKDCGKLIFLLYSYDAFTKHKMDIRRSYYNMFQMEYTIVFNFK